MARKKIRNKSRLKASVRRIIAAVLPEDAQILECYSGDDFLYRMVWSEYRGACIDKDIMRAMISARLRHDWAVYSGDTIRALSSGWMSHRPFDVVDVDCYGEPWPTIEALFKRDRTMPDEWWIVATDGCNGSITQGGPGRDLMAEQRRRVRMLCKNRGYNVAACMSRAPSHRTEQIWTHIFLIQKGDTAIETEALSASRTLAEGRVDTTGSKK